MDLSVAVSSNTYYGGGSILRPGGCVIVAVLFCAALAGVMLAQGTRASISGIVRDSTGAAVPAAEFNLRSLANSAVVKATSGADGFYAFPEVVAAAPEPNPFSEVVVRHGMTSLRYLANKPIKYHEAADLFCLDLYRFTDLDRLAALDAPTAVKTEVVEGISTR